MKTRIYGITAFVALIVGISVGRAADSPADVIDKAIKAAGGHEALAKAKAEEWTVKATLHTVGMKLPYDGEYLFASPDKFLVQIKMELGGQTITVKAGTDGTSTWTQVGGQAGEMTQKAEDMKKKQADAFLHSVYVMSVSQLLPLKSKDYSLALVDETKIGDKPALGVKVSKKGHADVTLWFDKESSLLVRVNTLIWDDLSDKDVPQEISLLDYKKKDGLMRNGKSTVKRDGKLMTEEEISDQKLVEKVDPKIFEKPKE